MTGRSCGPDNEIYLLFSREQMCILDPMTSREREAACGEHNFKEAHPALTCSHSFLHPKSHLRERKARLKQPLPGPRDVGLGPTAVSPGRLLETHTPRPHPRPSQPDTRAETQESEFSQVLQRGQGRGACRFKKLRVSVLGERRDSARVVRRLRQRWTPQV